MLTEVETVIVKLWLSLSVIVNICSSCLYLVVPAGTVTYFGGTATPSGTFWCSTAATGDSVSAAWSIIALLSNERYAIRDACRGMLVFIVVHFGAFLRGHWCIEKHKQGGTGYVLALIVGIALSVYFGFAANYS